MRSRLLASVSIVAVLAVGLVVDSRQDRPNSELALGQGASAQSAAWFCSVTAQGGSIVVDNAGEAATAVASFVAVDGTRGSTTFDVPANSQAIVRPSDSIDAPLVSTSINSASIDLSVRHRFDSDDAPLNVCSRRAATELNFVDGQTLGTNTLGLVVYNPFPDDAVINVTFDTEIGPSDPDTFDGVVVAPRSVVVLDIAGELRRREWVASHITVRRGRVVAEALQGTGDGSQSLLPSFEARSEWTFGASQVSSGVANQLTVFNPGGEETGVTVNITNASVDVIPFTLRVPSKGRVYIDLNAEPRVPKDQPVGVDVIADNNNLVIARRF